MPSGRMHGGEVETDVGLVARLLAGQFPQWVDLPMEPVASAGTDNALYRLGGDMVIRLPRIDWAVANVGKEYEWLPRLAAALPVAVPTPLAKGEPAEGYPWPWSVYRWLEGENPSAGEANDARALATELAHFIAALQRIDTAGAPPAPRGGPLVTRDAATRVSIDALRGTVDVDAVTAVWDEALRVPARVGQPVWLHGDLSPGNVLCVDGRLRGVIDFGMLGAGDPACDLLVAWNLLDASTRDVFRATLGVDDATWARGRALALSVALVQLPYYGDTNPTLAASSRYVIGQVLADCV